MNRAAHEQINRFKIAFWNADCSVADEAYQKPVLSTGVDRIVALVESRKRISLFDVAVELGMPAKLVQELVDLLEEKKIISVQYRFHVPYLVAKRMAAETVQQKVRELKQDEPLIKDVDSIRTQAQPEGASCDSKCSCAQKDKNPFNESMSSWVLLFDHNQRRLLQRMYELERKIRLLEGEKPLNAASRGVLSK